MSVAKDIYAPNLSKIKARIAKGGLTQEEKSTILSKAMELLNAEKERFKEIKELDPFQFYQPSNGDIGIEGMNLMKEFLKEEDIPQGKLQGQLDVHTSTSNIILDAGGNQGGKSTTGAIEAFIKATGELPESLKDVYPKEKLPMDNAKNPRHVRVVGVDFPTFLKNILPTYQKWVPREYLVDGSWEKSYNSEGRVLKLGKKGVLYGTVEFMTNEQSVRSFQGPPRHKIIYDEEPLFTIYKENLMRFTTADRLDILFCMTPTEGMSWVKDEILDKSETKEGYSISCFKVPSITNKLANIDILREVLGSLGSYEEIKMRLLGEFVSLSGLVYGGLFNPKIHIIPPFFENLNVEQKKEYLVLSGWDMHLVTPNAGVFMLVDREGNKYIDRCYFKGSDTQELKDEFQSLVKQSGYRMGWSAVDKSSNSSIVAFGGRNIYKEVSTGKNAIPGLRTSEKFEGSIRAGVDEIKKDLKINPATKKPKLFIVDRAENKLLINAIRNMERDTFVNEDDKGPKDKIKEGKFHLHAAMRYLYQYPINWIPQYEAVPEPPEERYI